ncbi:MAG: AraC family transcriptional regulator, partial [Muribaculum sp.]|nr:AraC family transcriptional regulator [Muribaculum sp.]
TMEAIVRNLGFKSRSTFSKTFKKLTGLNPSEFQRLSSNKNYTDTRQSTTRPL